jgi:hypothetical protein
MDDEVYRKRLLFYSLVRFFGLAVFLLGVAIAYMGIIRPGGYPQFGAIVAILGVLDAFLAPRLLKKSWDLQDKERE